MKTADARLIALALFTLALSLPVSAWIHRGQSATNAAPPVVVSPATGTTGTVVTVPTYQIIETDEGVLRLDTGNGETQILVNKQWHDL